MFLTSHRTAWWPYKLSHIKAPYLFKAQSLKFWRKNVENRWIWKTSFFETAIFICFIMERKEFFCQKGILKKKIILGKSSNFEFWLHLVWFSLVWPSCYPKISQFLLSCINLEASLYFANWAGPTNLGRILENKIYMYNFFFY